VNVLDAQTRPSFVQQALREFPALRASVVLLECSSELRRQRLIARGQSELANEKMNLWAAYLRGQADAFGIPVIDTSQLSVADAASTLEEHVEALRHHTRDLSRAT
jgi:dephospho-CoA kinase